MSQATTWSKSCSTALLLLWLLLAQSTRWATPWVAWGSWAVLGGLAAWWLLRRKRTALQAIWRSPLLPVVGIAAVSALANGGDWSRVADLGLYAMAWAFFSDQPMDGHLVAVGWGLIGVCLLEWAYLLLHHGGGRVHLLGNANVIACALAVTLPAGRGAWWWGLGSLAMLATGSRAGLAGLGLYLVARKPGLFKKTGFWIVAALVGIALAVLRLRNTAWRLEHAIQAVRLFLDHPWLGVGPGRYQFGIWGHAHNVLLTWLAETGLIGLAGPVAAAIRYRRLSPDRLAPLALIAPFYLVDDQVMYWFNTIMAIYWLERSRS